MAARLGDETIYDKIVQALRNPKTPENYLNESNTLSKFTEPKLVERTLEYAISPQIRSQDAVALIYIVMQNPDAAKQAWNFVQAHWSDIENLGGPLAGGLIVQATGNFCDPGMRDEVQAFFTSHPAPAAERSLKKSAEQINCCVDRKTLQRDQPASWLQRRSPSGTQ